MGTAKNGASLAWRSGHPVLITARSGGPRSMSGMMDPILNLGLTDKAVNIDGGSYQA